MIRLCRFKPCDPCPVCGGHPAMHQHRGQRCWGGWLPDGKSVVCTREDRAGSITYNHKTQGYHHYLDERCKCGVGHSGIVAPAKVVDFTGDAWYAITPVPDYAARPTFSHRDFPWGHSRVWAYRDRAGHLLCYRVRFERPDGSKAIRPYSYGSRREDAKYHNWAWRQVAGKQTLYGLELFDLRPDADVLVCEGEKAADAGRIIFPEKLVIAWPGGAGNTANVDWSPVAGRNVTFWPDADAEGAKAAANGAQLAIKAGAQEVAIAELPSGLPKGWDLSDALEMGMEVAL